MRAKQAKKKMRKIAFLAYKNHRSAAGCAPPPGSASGVYIVMINYELDLNQKISKQTDKSKNKIYDSHKLSRADKLISVAKQVLLIIILHCFSSIRNVTGHDNDY